MPLTTGQMVAAAVCCFLVVIGIVLGVYYGGSSSSSSSGSSMPTGGSLAAFGNTASTSNTTPASSSTTTPAAAAHTGTGTTSQSFGGGGGGDYAMNCPSGNIVKNISGRGGWWVDQLNGKCDDGTTLTPAGGQGGGPVNTTDCPTGYTGVDVVYGQYVGKVTPKCAGTPISTPIGGGLGSGSGQSGSFDCPSGQVITGITGKAGGFVDSMKVTCK